MVSPGLVTAATIVSLVLLIVPMLALTVIAARSDAHSPPGVREEAEEA